MKKLFAALTVSIFTSQTLFAAAPAVPVSPRAVLNFEIPESLGHIETLFPPAFSGLPDIIHIQDAHAQPEAQRNIELMLEELQKQGKLGQIAVEGAFEPVDTAFLNYLPVPGANLAAVQYLLSLGELTGAEFFAFKHPRTLQGVDEWNLYKQSFTAFRQIKLRKEQTRDVFKAYEQAFQQLETRFYGEDLRKLAAAKQSWQIDNAGSLEYFNVLGDLSQRYLGIELLSSREQWNWPNLSRLLAAHREEKDLDLEKAGAQLRDLKASARKNLKKGKARDFLLRGLGLLERDPESLRSWLFVQDMAPEIRTLRSFFEKLYEETRSTDLALYVFPDFLTRAGILILQEEIDARKLFTEIEKIEARLEEKLLRSREEKEIYRLSQKFALLIKLLSLEMSREDFEIYKKEEQEFREGLIQKGLEKYSKKDLPAVPDDLLMLAGEFYRLSRKRDLALVENTLKLKRKKGKATVLIAGGFHSEGLAQLLKEKNISFTVVTPKITHLDDSNLYEKGMLGENFQNGNLAAVSNLIKILLSQGVRSPALYDQLSLAGQENLVQQAFRTDSVRGQLYDSGWNDAQIALATRAEVRTGTPAEQTFGQKALSVWDRIFYGARWLVLTAAAAAGISAFFTPLFVSMPLLVFSGVLVVGVIVTAIAHSFSDWMALAQEYAASVFWDKLFHWRWFSLSGGFVSAAVGVVTLVFLPFTVWTIGIAIFGFVASAALISAFVVPFILQNSSWLANFWRSLYSQKREEFRNALKKGYGEAEYSGVLHQKLYGGSDANVEGAGNFDELNAALRNEQSGSVSAYLDGALKSPGIQEPAERAQAERKQREGWVRLLEDLEAERTQTERREHPGFSPDGVEVLGDGTLRVRLRLPSPNGRGFVEVEVIAPANGEAADRAIKQAGNKKISAQEEVLQHLRLSPGSRVEAGDNLRQAVHYGYSEREVSEELYREPLDVKLAHDQQVLRRQQGYVLPAPLEYAAQEFIAGPGGEISHPLSRVSAAKFVDQQRQNLTAGQSYVWLVTAEEIGAIAYLYLHSQVRLGLLQKKGRRFSIPGFQTMLDAQSFAELEHLSEQDRKQYAHEALEVGEQLALLGFDQDAETLQSALSGVESGVMLQETKSDHKLKVYRAIYDQYLIDQLLKRVQNDRNLQPAAAAEFVRSLLSGQYDLASLRRMLADDYLKPVELQKLEEDRAEGFNLFLRKLWFRLNPAPLPGSSPAGISRVIRKNLGGVEVQLVGVTSGIETEAASAIGREVQDPANHDAVAEGLTATLFGNGKVPAGVEVISYTQRPQVTRFQSPAEAAAFARHQGPLRSATVRFVGELLKNIWKAGALRSVPGAVKPIFDNGAVGVQFTQFHGLQSPWLSDASEVMTKTLEPDLTEVDEYAVNAHMPQFLREAAQVFPEWFEFNPDARLNSSVAPALRLKPQFFIDNPEFVKLVPQPSVTQNDFIDKVHFAGRFEPPVLALERKKQDANEQVFIRLAAEAVQNLKRRSPDATKTTRFYFPDNLLFWVNYFWDRDAEVVRALSSETYAPSDSELEAERSTIVGDPVAERMGVLHRVLMSRANAALGPNWKSEFLRLVRPNQSSETYLTTSTASLDEIIKVLRAKRILNPGEQFQTAEDRNRLARAIDYAVRILVRESENIPANDPRHIPHTVSSLKPSVPASAAPYQPVSDFDEPGPFDFKAGGLTVRVHGVNLENPGPVEKNLFEALRELAKTQGQVLLATEGVKSSKILNAGSIERVRDLYEFFWLGAEAGKPFDSKAFYGYIWGRDYHPKEFWSKFGLRWRMSRWESVMSQAPELFGFYPRDDSYWDAVAQHAFYNHEVDTSVPYSLETKNAQGETVVLRGALPALLFERAQNEGLEITDLNFYSALETYKRVLSKSPRQGTVHLAGDSRVLLWLPYIAQNYPVVGRFLAPGGKKYVPSEQDSEQGKQEREQVPPSEAGFVRTPLHEKIDGIVKRLDVVKDPDAHYTQDFSTKNLALRILKNSEAADPQNPLRLVRQSLSLLNPQTGKSEGFAIQPWEIISAWELSGLLDMDTTSRFNPQDAKDVFWGVLQTVSAYVNQDGVAKVTKDTQQTVKANGKTFRVAGFYDDAQARLLMGNVAAPSVLAEQEIHGQLPTDLKTTVLNLEDRSRLPVEIRHQTEKDVRDVLEGTITDSDDTAQRTAEEVMAKVVLALLSGNITEPLRVTPAGERVITLDSAMLSSLSRAWNGSVTPIDELKNAASRIPGASVEAEGKKVRVLLNEAAVLHLRKLPELKSKLNEFDLELRASVYPLALPSYVAAEYASVSGRESGAGNEDLAIAVQAVELAPAVQQGQEILVLVDPSRVRTVADLLAHPNILKFYQNIDGFAAEGFDRAVSEGSRSARWAAGNKYEEETWVYKRKQADAFTGYKRYVNLKNWINTLHEQMRNQWQAGQTVAAVTSAFRYGWAHFVFFLSNVWGLLWTLFTGFPLYAPSARAYLIQQLIDNLRQRSGYNLSHAFKEPRSNASRYLSEQVLKSSSYEEFLQNVRKLGLLRDWEKFSATPDEYQAWAGLSTEILYPEDALPAALEVMARKAFEKGGRSEARELGALRFNPEGLLQVAVPTVGDRESIRRDGKAQIEGPDGEINPARTSAGISNEVLGFNPHDRERSAKKIRAAIERALHEGHDVMLSQGTLQFAGYDEKEIKATRKQFKDKKLLFVELPNKNYVPSELTNAAAAAAYKKYQEEHMIHGPLGLFQRLSTMDFTSGFTRWRIGIGITAVLAWIALIVFGPPTVAMLGSLSALTLSTFPVLLAVLVYNFLPQDFSRKLFDESGEVRSKSWSVWRQRLALEFAANLTLGKIWGTALMTLIALPAVLMLAYFQVPIVLFGLTVPLLISLTFIAFSLLWIQLPSNFILKRISGTVSGFLGDVVVFFLNLIVYGVLFGWFYLPDFNFLRDFLNEARKNFWDMLETQPFQEAVENSRLYNQLKAETEFEKHGLLSLHEASLLPAALRIDEAKRNPKDVQLTYSILEAAGYTRLVYSKSLDSKRGRDVFTRGRLVHIVQQDVASFVPFFMDHPQVAEDFLRQGMAAQVPPAKELEARKLFPDVPQTVLRSVKKAVARGEKYHVRLASIDVKPGTWEEIIFDSFVPGTISRSPAEDSRLQLAQTYAWAITRNAFFRAAQELNTQDEARIREWAVNKIAHLVDPAQSTGKTVNGLRRLRFLPEEEVSNLRYGFPDSPQLVWAVTHLLVLWALGSRVMKLEAAGELPHFVQKKTAKVKQPGGKVIAEVDYYLFPEGRAEDAAAALSKQGIKVDLVEQVPGVEAAFPGTETLKEMKTLSTGFPSWSDAESRDRFQGEFDLYQAYKTTRGKALRKVASGLVGLLSRLPMSLIEEGRALVPVSSNNIQTLLGSLDQPVMRNYLKNIEAGLQALEPAYLESRTGYAQNNSYDNLKSLLQNDPAKLLAYLASVLPDGGVEYDPARPEFIRVSPGLLLDAKAFENDTYITSDNKDIFWDEFLKLALSGRGALPQPLLASRGIQMEEFQATLFSQALFKRAKEAYEAQPADTPQAPRGPVKIAVALTSRVGGYSQWQMDNNIAQIEAFLTERYGYKPDGLEMIAARLEKLSRLFQRSEFRSRAPRSESRMLGSVINLWQSVFGSKPASTVPGPTAEQTAEYRKLKAAGKLPSIRQLGKKELTGKTVLIRIGADVPLDKEGRIEDNKRVRAHLETLKYLIDNGATVLVLNHISKEEADGQKKPGGRVVLRYSNRVVAEELQKLLGELYGTTPAPRVNFLEGSVNGNGIVADKVRMIAGAINVLENTRFGPDENNSPYFAKQIADLGDLYVNDAPSVAHRDQSSTTGPIIFGKGPSYIGFAMEKERDLAKALRPDLIFGGGSKVSDKILLVKKNIENLPPGGKYTLQGAIAYTVLKAMGKKVGNSLVEEGQDAAVQQIFDAAAAKGISREDLLPLDHLVIKIKPGVKKKITELEADDILDIKFTDGLDIEDGWVGVEVGPKTIARNKRWVMAARSTFWNGPSGVFEIDSALRAAWQRKYANGKDDQQREFQVGTEELAKVYAEATARNNVQTYLGGGDTGNAAKKYGIEDKVTYGFLGGGATIEVLEGKTWPVETALDNWWEGRTQAKAEREKNAIDKPFKLNAPKRPFYWGLNGPGPTGSEALKAGFASFEEDAFFEQIYDGALQTRSDVAILKVINGVSDIDKFGAQEGAKRFAQRLLTHSTHGDFKSHGRKVQVRSGVETGGRPYIEIGIEVSRNKVKWSERIYLFNQRGDDRAFPWGQNWGKHGGVKIVFDASGSGKNDTELVKMLDRESARRFYPHLNKEMRQEGDPKGAKRVVYATGSNVPMIMIGVNDGDLIDKPEHKMTSNASCTTNCIGPVVKSLAERHGILRALLTTIHAFTNDQKPQDMQHEDPERRRNAMANILSAATGAAKNLGEVVPAANKIFDGTALRVPVEDGSLSDLVLILPGHLTAAEVNALIRRAAETNMRGIIDFTEENLTSSRIVDNTASAIFQANKTKAIPMPDGTTMVKLGAVWYDNEVGFSTRALDHVLQAAYVEEQIEDGKITIPDDVKVTPAPKKAKKSKAAVKAAPAPDLTGIPKLERPIPARSRRVVVNGAENLTTRALIRQILTSGRPIELFAINGIAGVLSGDEAAKEDQRAAALKASKTLAHHLRRDSNSAKYQVFPAQGNITAVEGGLDRDGHYVKGGRGYNFLIFKLDDGTEKPVLLLNNDQMMWGPFHIETIFETRSLKKKADLEKQAANGAKRVILIDNPDRGEADVDPVQFGINEEKAVSQRVFASAGYVAAAAAPVIKVLKEKLGAMGVMLDAALQLDETDGHQETSAGPAARTNIVPKETSAIAQIRKLVGGIPVDGSVTKVPAQNASAVVLDVAFPVDANVTVEQINAAIQAAAGTALNSVVYFIPQGDLQDLDQKLVSSDFRDNEYSANFNPAQTMVIDGRLAKVILWVDANEAVVRNALDIDDYVMAKAVGEDRTARTPAKKAVETALAPAPAPAPALRPAIARGTVSVSAGELATMRQQLAKNPTPTQQEEILAKLEQVDPEVAAAIQNALLKLPYSARAVLNAMGRAGIENPILGSMTPRSPLSMEALIRAALTQPTILQIAETEGDRENAEAETGYAWPSFAEFRAKLAELIEKVIRETGKTPMVVGPNLDNLRVEVSLKDSFEKQQAEIARVEAVIHKALAEGFTLFAQYATKLYDEGAALEVIAQHFGIRKSGEQWSAEQLKDLRQKLSDDTQLPEDVQRKVALAGYAKVIEVNAYLSALLPPWAVLESDIGEAGVMEYATGEPVMGADGKHAKRPTTAVEAQAFVEALAQKRYEIWKQDPAYQVLTKEDLLILLGVEGKPEFEGLDKEALLKMLAQPDFLAIKSAARSFGPGVDAKVEAYRDIEKSAKAIRDRFRTAGLRTKPMMHAVSGTDSRLIAAGTARKDLAKYNVATTFHWAHLEALIEMEDQTNLVSPPVAAQVRELRRQIFNFVMTLYKPEGDKEPNFYQELIASGYNPKTGEFKGESANKKKAAYARLKAIRDNKNFALAFEEEFNALDESAKEYIRQKVEKYEREYQQAFLPDAEAGANLNDRLRQIIHRGTVHLTGSAIDEIMAAAERFVAIRVPEVQPAQGPVTVVGNHKSIPKKGLDAQLGKASAALGSSGNRYIVLPAALNFTSLPDGWEDRLATANVFRGAPRLDAAVLDGKGTTARNTGRVSADMLSKSEIEYAVVRPGRFSEMLRRINAALEEGLQPVILVDASNSLFIYKLLEAVPSTSRARVILASSEGPAHKFFKTKGAWDKAQKAFLVSGNDPAALEKIKATRQSNPDALIINVWRNAEKQEAVPQDPAAYLTAVERIQKGSKKRVVVVPPMLALGDLGLSGRRSRPAGVFLGLQNASDMRATGMPKDAGYILYGHQEAEQSDADVAKDYLAENKHGQIMIVYVSSSDYTQGRLEEGLRAQLRRRLSGADAEKIKNTLFIFELSNETNPHDAPAAKVNASQVNAILKVFRRLLAERILLNGFQGNVATLASQLQLGYGGAMDATNIAEYAAQPEIKILMLGSASPDDEKLLPILQALSGTSVAPAAPEPAQRRVEVPPPALAPSNGERGRLDTPRDAQELDTRRIIVPAPAGQRASVAGEQLEINFLRRPFPVLVAPQAATGATSAASRKPEDLTEFLNSNLGWGRTLHRWTSWFSNPTGFTTVALNDQEQVLRDIRAAIADGKNSPVLIYRGATVVFGHKWGKTLQALNESEQKKLILIFEFDKLPAAEEMAQLKEYFTKKGKLGLNISAEHVVFREVKEGAASSAAAPAISSQPQNWAAWQEHLKGVVKELSALEASGRRADLEETNALWEFVLSQLQQVPPAYRALVAAEIDALLLNQSPIVRRVATGLIQGATVRTESRSLIAAYEKEKDALTERAFAAGLVHQRQEALLAEKTKQRLKALRGAASSADSAALIEALFSIAVSLVSSHPDLQEEISWWAAHFGKIYKVNTLRPAGRLSSFEGRFSLYETLGKIASFLIAKGYFNNSGDKLTGDRADEAASGVFRNLSNQLPWLQALVAIAEGALDEVDTLVTGEKIGLGHQFPYTGVPDLLKALLALDPIEITKGVYFEKVKGSSIVLLLAKEGTIQPGEDERVSGVFVRPGTVVTPIPFLDIEGRALSQEEAAAQQVAVRANVAALAQGRTASSLKISTLFRERHKLLVRTLVESGVPAAFPKNQEAWLANRKAAAEWIKVDAGNFEEYWSFLKKVMDEKEAWYDGAFGIDDSAAAANGIKLFNDGTVGAVQAVGTKLDATIASAKYAETLAQIAISKALGLSVAVTKKGTENLTGKFFKGDDFVVVVTAIKPNAWDDKVQGVKFDGSGNGIVTHQIYGGSGLVQTLQTVAAKGEIDSLSSSVAPEVPESPRGVRQLSEARRSEARFVESPKPVVTRLEQRTAHAPSAAIEQAYRAGASLWGQSYAAKRWVAVHIAFGFFITVPENLLSQIKPFLDWDFRDVWAGAAAQDKESQNGVDIRILNQLPQGEERDMYFWGVKKVLEQKPGLKMEILFTGGEALALSAEKEFEREYPALAGRFQIRPVVSHNLASAVQQIVSGQLANRSRNTREAYEHVTISGADKIQLERILMGIRIHEDLQMTPGVEAFFNEVKSRYALRTGLTAEQIRKLKEIESHIISAAGMLSSENLGLVQQAFDQAWRDRTFYQSA